MEQLTFWSAEPLANLFPLPVLEKDLKTREEILHLPIAEFLIALDPSGSYGKTCRVSSVATVDGTLVPSSGRWLNSGMGSPTECLTLSTSEWPSAAVVCSLSDVLETGEMPQRFYLSQKACAGILRRADKRGKKLPEQLRQALLMVAQVGDQRVLLENISNRTQLLTL